jgi:flagellar hook-length control protein FliK
MEMLDARPQHADGRYTIEAAAVEGDKVSLTLKAKDNPDRLIHLSIPTDRLASAIAPTTVDRAARVSVAAFDGDRNTELQALFDKLRLSELTIHTEKAEVVGRQAVSHDQDSKQITIVIGESGNEQALRLKLKSSEATLRERLSLPRTAAKVSSALSKSDSASAETEITSVDRTPDPARALSEDPKVATRGAAAAVKDDATNWQDLLNIKAATQPETGLTDQFQFSSTATLGRSSLADQPLPKVDLSNTPVRITLPDNSLATLKPGGSSVTISIEPEHLGPARLRLEMRRDVLTARLTVDHAPAKAALEQSIDQLTQQLSRAGVKVDQIEVMLSGGDADNQAFTRQPVWNRQRGAGARPFSLDSVYEPTANTDIVMPRARSYVGADGVNVLA